MNNTSDLSLEQRLSFRTVFRTVVMLTLLSLIAALALSASVDPSDGQRQMLETCSTCWKLGFGAIVGMIGAKAT